MGVCKAGISLKASFKMARACRFSPISDNCVFRDFRPDRMEETLEACSVWVDEIMGMESLRPRLDGGGVGSRRRKEASMAAMLSSKVETVVNVESDPEFFSDVSLVRLCRLALARRDKSEQRGAILPDRGAVMLGRRRRRSSGSGLCSRWTRALL